MEDRWNANPIHVIGSDGAGWEKLGGSQKKLILNSKGIAAPKRLLKNLQPWWDKNSKGQKIPAVIPSDNPQELIDWLKHQKGMSVVLASGDPLWFGIGRHLIAMLPNKRLYFHPAPTSLQLAFARIGRPWQDASWISLHGRDPSPLADLLKQRPKALAVLTDPNNGGAETVKKILIASGLESAYAMWICERLGHPKERVRRILPEEIINKGIDPLHLVVLLEEKRSESLKKSLPLFGIRDGEFLQNEDRPGLMTKREVRIQLLAELELPENGVLWDLGSGIGSIGLEALRLRPLIRLLSVDKRVGSSTLIKANATRLSVNPTVIIEDDVLNLTTKNSLPEGLDKPNRVILGGGGPQRNNLLKFILQRLEPKGIVVIPLATIEPISDLKKLLEASDCDVSISQIQAYRGLPLSNGTRLSPINPVFIVTGKLKH